MSRQLYDATAEANKEIVLIKGGERASHQNGETICREKILAFMHRCFGLSSSTYERNDARGLQDRIALNNGMVPALRERTSMSRHASDTEKCGTN